MHSTTAVGRSRPLLQWRIGQRGDLILIGGVALLLSLVLGGLRPLAAGDEAASIASSRRPVAALWEMLGNIDAVHGTYYLFLHGWAAVFGYSAFAVRLPSALAVALSAVVVTAIGQRVGSRQLGLVAGTLMVALPRVEWAGTTTREYSISILFGAVLVGVVLHYWRVGDTRSWAVLAVVAMIGTYVFLFFLLGVAGAVLAAQVLRVRRLGTTTAAAAAAVVAVPLAAVSSRQGSQVSWIATIGSSPSAVRSNLVEQYAGGEGLVRSATGAAVPAVTGTIETLVWPLAVAIVVLAWMGARRHLHGPTRPLVVLTASIGLVPLAVLLLAQLVGHPLYVARYLSFTCAAVALLVGLGLVGLRTPLAVRTAVFGVVVVLGLVLSTHQTLGVVNLMDQTSVIAQAKRPGAIAVVNSPSYLNRRVVDPDAFRGVRIVNLRENGAQADNIWGVARAAVPADYAGRRQVWYLGPDVEQPDIRLMLQAGCRIVGQWDGGLRELDCRAAGGRQR